MKFLCLVYDDGAGIDSIPEQEYDAIVRDVLEYREELKRRGNYIASSPLEAADTAKTVRVRNGKTITTDGPFAETKDQVGGFYLIEAEDLDDALRLVEQMPPVRFSAIEVRALKIFEQER